MLVAYDYIIEADDKDEAVRQVDEADLPNLGDTSYIDQSFEINHDSIDEIDPPIFVFGSNLAGRHGLGAAKTAHEKFGAVMGKGVGRTGQCYAIPTKDKDFSVLPIDRIKVYVDNFISYARENFNLRFYVTKIGCGLAGYTEEEIAPLFDACPSNCELRFFKEEELL